MSIKFLKIAKEQIKEHKYSDDLEYRLCAIIVKGGNILSIGFNKRPKNSFVRHFQKGLRDHCQATHAELDSILSARKKIDLTGAKIFVARLLANDTVAMSRPCNLCEHVIYRYSINKAYYTIDNNHYGIMKILPNGQTQDKIMRVGE